MLLTLNWSNNIADLFDKGCQFVVEVAPKSTTSGIFNAAAICLHHQADINRKLTIVQEIQEIL